MVRCAKLTNLTESSIARNTIQEMVANSFSQLRKEVRNLTVIKKMEYFHHLAINDKGCRQLVSWRTWLAIRYGITWFI